MNPSNNENRIDRFKEGVENALEMRAKKLKEMAATVGIGLLYGLLFAGLLFAPLLPHLAAQSNSPTNNAPTNSVHRDVFYNNNEFGDANSREDCDQILQKVLEEIENQNRKIKDAYDAAIECDTTYNESLKTNEDNHNLNMARAANQADEIFWDCMGFGGLAGATAAGVSKWSIEAIRGGITTTARIGSGIAGLVVSIGAFAICYDLRSDTAQGEVDAANTLKKNADELALNRRDRCREDTNYARAMRRHYLWHPRRSSSGKG